MVPPEGFMVRSVTDGPYLTRPACCVLRPESGTQAAGLVDGPLAMTGSSPCVPNLLGDCR